MSSATRVPTIARALATIRYAEMVADLMAGIIILERKEEKLPTDLPAFRVKLVDLLRETDKFRNDYRVDIKGLDFQKLHDRVIKACHRSQRGE